MKFAWFVAVLSIKSTSGQLITGNQDVGSWMWGIESIDLHQVNKLIIYAGNGEWENWFFLFFVTSHREMKIEEERIEAEKIRVIKS